ncbi:metal-dependent amidase/aminoacylase/carboxypeptidase [Lindgomyces ingoldianus]|uniref:Metal-dependent amidase/aminoacylase/carboxypeptidase n=1 Tax=Lindgomyces ingoldianus TaxID=673940 RepID=A0ACB6QK35_9PLEO|nr:metal-dependent amidase/aminoacylase/carboxypeptidase [Lindgomyces ingoldianus]KAF2467246.1 metal-dependent amidase/aminoacylase/carboxypeptidase [Lindgomyces ingoldianus]
MPSISEVIEAHRPALGQYEDLYKHFHTSPELSFQETETAAKIVDHLKSLDVYEIFANIGGGVAAVLKNGAGKTILLRADIDALPVEEKSGVEYASTRRMKDLDGAMKPCMHACGHDMHITALLAAAETLAKAKEMWVGKLVLVFQPAEERAGGARAMVDGGLYQKVPEPDLCVGAHVMAYRAEGVIGTRHGLVASSADSFLLTIHGRQAHASMPSRSIDPIVQASSTILRLQTIVAREVDPADFAVVTVSAIHAGDAENIIPDRADVKINVRTAKPEVRERVLSSIRRIIDAEAAASNAPPPEFKPTTQFPFLYNDPDVTFALEKTFSSLFPLSPHGYTTDIPRLPGSEDFGILATSIGKPSCFFLYGGTDPGLYDKAEKEGKLLELPVNHSPFFIPVLQPTLKVGVDGYVAAALTFLGK